MHQEIITKFNLLKEKQLSIDITRGKPDTDQLDLSNELLNISIPTHSEDDIDLRNYGEPFGIKEARRLGSELLDAPIENILAGEQSSLLLTYQTVLSKMGVILRTKSKNLKYSSNVLYCLQSLS